MSQPIPYEDSQSTKPSPSPEDGGTQSWRGSTAAPPTPSLLDTGRYRSLRFHARGGLGEVHVADDTELPRRVALKRMQPAHAGDPNMRQRFLREAEITSRLEHPGIVPIYGLIKNPEGEPSYAMRFVEGETLEQAAARLHGLPEGPERTRLLRQLLTRFVAVCSTVAFAHSRGVLHRDLKPRNIMLGAFGESYVIDWGLAKAQQEAAADRLADGATPGEFADAEGTQAGQALGTPAYMSPEQARGDWANLTVASDVYGLGATLYFLLTYQPPFAGSGEEIVRRVARGELPPPAPRVRSSISVQLSAICQRAMQADPHARYAGAVELAADLERWLGDEPVSAYRDSRWTRLTRWAKRHGRIVAGTVSALIVVTIGLAVAVPLLLSARAQAEDEARRSEAAVFRGLRAIDESKQVLHRFIPRHPLLVSRDLEDPRLRKLRAEMLASAARQYEALLEDIGSNPRTEYELCINYSNLANVLGDLALDFPEGSPELAALRARQQDALVRCKALVDRLLAQGNRSRRLRLLAVDLRSDRPKGIRDLEELLAEDPADLVVLEELGRVMMTDGMGLHKRKEYEEAIPLFNRAVELYESWSKKSDRRTSRFLLGHALELLADCKRLGEPQAAAALQQRAIAVYRQLLQEDPLDMHAQERLAESLTHGTEANKRDAHAFFEQKWDEFLKNHPIARSLQLHLLRMNENVAVLEGAASRRDEALKALRRARELGRRLEPISEDSAVAQFLAAAPGDMAELLGPWGPPSERLALLDEAIRNHGRLQADPQATDKYDWQLGYLHDSKGMTLARLGQAPQAHSALKTAQHHLTLAAQAAPEDVRAVRQFFLVRSQAHALQVDAKDQEAAKLLHPFRSGWKGNADMLHLLAVEYARCALGVAHGREDCTPAEKIRRDDYLALALSLLREAHDAGDTDQEDLQRNPDFAPLRSHKDFQSLLKR